jgi:hypothetical protein
MKVIQVLLIHLHMPLISRIIIYYLNIHCVGVCVCDRHKAQLVWYMKHKQHSSSYASPIRFDHTNIKFKKIQGFF